MEVRRWMEEVIPRYADWRITMYMTVCAYIVARKRASMHEFAKTLEHPRISQHKQNSISTAHTQYQNPESSPCMQKGYRTEECLTLSHRNTLKKFTGIWQATENVLTKQCTCPLSMAQRSNQHTYTALHRFISTPSRKGSAIMRSLHKWQRNGYLQTVGSQKQNTRPWR